MKFYLFIFKVFKQLIFYSVFKINTATTCPGCTGTSRKSLMRFLNYWRNKGAFQSSCSSNRNHFVWFSALPGLWHLGLGAKSDQDTKYQLRRAMQVSPALLVVNTSSKTAIPETFRKELKRILPYIPDLTLLKWSGGKV